MIASEFAANKNTKIIATVGPASYTYENLLALVRAGVNIFRLNFSHGTHQDHLKVIESILYINEKYDLHVGILADLQGPKLRVGIIENNGISLEAGDIVTFVNEECIGTRERIYMSYQPFAKDVKMGERVLLDDGKLQFEVVETNQLDTVRMKVLFGGILSSNKGVNLPDTQVSQPALTDKDKKDLDFILTQPVNWIALSFVRSPKDIKDLKKRIESKGHFAKVIAKIEKPEAVAQIDKIIKASNAIMIARGDLAVELPMEKMPLIQKDIIHKCIQRARPVIVATQMMETMIENPSPTRAEITDVANAVLDGADAVMLSAETAKGKYPVQVIETMVRIIHEAEKHPGFAIHPEPTPRSRTFFSDVVCFSACETAEKINAKAIVGMTSSGYTAFKVSSWRPRTSEIFIFSDRMPMLATLNLCWGVKCFYYDKFTTTDESIQDVNEIIKAAGYVQAGDAVVNTGSMPLNKRYRTNMLRVTLIE